jgi:hypothetical protein
MNFNFGFDSFNKVEVPMLILCKNNLDRVGILGVA